MRVLLACWPKRHPRPRVSVRVAKQPIIASFAFNCPHPDDLLRSNVTQITHGRVRLGVPIAGSSSFVTQKRHLGGRAWRVVEGVGGGGLGGGGGGGGGSGVEFTSKITQTLKMLGTVYSELRV